MNHMIYKIPGVTGHVRFNVGFRGGVGVHDPPPPQKKIQR